MRLKNLKINNFRKIKSLNIEFPPGLCVLVGENNAGKTAIIDALRLIFIQGRDSDSLRFTEDDFRNDLENPPIEISCIFSELSEVDEIRFQECLIDVNEGLFNIQVNARVEFNEETKRANIKFWGGETEGGHLPSNFYDFLAAVYLQPLRDPERGLRPGMNSQVSRLISSLTAKEEYPSFVEIVKESNNKLKELEPIKNSKDEINNQISSITGKKLAQTTELIISDPSFRKIISNLQPQIDGLPFHLNGLGYNNIIFMAMTLGTLQQSPSFSFRSILVEEPEAHLHPQLQVLLLKHFAEVSATKDSQVQVIASSHSPTLVSQSPIDSIISIHEHEGKVFAVPIHSLSIDIVLKKKLQRFLDVTRGELFFARKILMVEGIAEALLLPILAKKSGGCLKESSVTLLNVNGINFDAFLALFGLDKLNIPVVVLTDGDAKSLSDPLSDSANKLKGYEVKISNLLVSISHITFEHELARSINLLPMMLDSFENMHPRLGSKLKSDIDSLSSPDERADKFLEIFLSSRTSKGEFAQELALKLESSEIKIGDIPNYIVNALKFLDVIR